MKERKMTGKIFDSKGSELISLDRNTVYCLGRERGESGSGILIDDIFVSRRHAEIGCDNGYYILDRRSKNGTYVNSKRITPGEKHFLRDGDRLRLADREYSFACDSGEDAENEGGEGLQENENRAEVRGEKYWFLKADAGGGDIEEIRAADLGEEWSREVGEESAGPERAEDRGNNNQAKKRPEATEEVDEALSAASAIAEAEAAAEGEDEEEKERGAWGPFVYSLRSSAAGRRLSVETGQKGCVNYQIRMIEENPNLMISEVRHVRKIENDCFLCDIGGRFALKDYLKKDRKGIDGIDLVDRILKLVKTGEEHMLDRDRYFLTPSTIFMDKDGSLMLVYIPHMDRKDHCFSKGMAELCALLSELYPDREAGLLAMEKLFREDVCDTREYIKHIYHYKLIDLPKPAGRERKKGGSLPVKYIITGLSFILFMAVFWFSNLNYINLGGIFLILVGGNVLLYNKRKGVDEDVKGQTVHN